MCNAGVVDIQKAKFPSEPRPNGEWIGHRALEDPWLGQNLSLITELFLKLQCASNKRAIAL